MEIDMKKLIIVLVMLVLSGCVAGTQVRYADGSICRWGAVMCITGMTQNTLPKCSDNDDQCIENNIRKIDEALEKGLSKWEWAAYVNERDHIMSPDPSRVTISNRFGNQVGVYYVK
jgi:hypothetical protein